MARVGETVKVYYIENQDISGGRWYVKDQYGDNLNSFSKKKQAVLAAKRFTKDRAKATGVKSKLVIEKKDGSIARSHTYKP